MVFFIVYFLCTFVAVLSVFLITFFFKFFFFVSNYSGFINVLGLVWKSKRFKYFSSRPYSCAVSTFLSQVMSSWLKIRLLGTRKDDTHFPSSYKEQFPEQEHKNILSGWVCSYSPSLPWSPPRSSSFVNRLLGSMNTGVGLLLFR